MYPLIGNKIKAISTDNNINFTLDIYTDSILKFSSIEQDFVEIVEYLYKKLEENIYILYWKCCRENIFMFQVHNIKNNTILACDIIIESTLFSQNFYKMESFPIPEYYCGPTAIFYNSKTK
jgi:hypothetical protein